MIQLKSEVEIGYMRRAGRALADWMRHAINQIQNNGWTGRDAANDINDLIVYLNDMEPIYIWDLPFSHVRDYGEPICISVNDEVVHSRPTDKPFEPGDIVTIDAGLSYNGYCADMARTILVPGRGRFWEPKHTLLLGQTDAANRMARVKCVPGNRISDLSREIYQVAMNNGYGVVTHFSGHGIGAELHEDPQIPNDPAMVSPAMNDLLRPGMTLCLEPMFILGGSGRIVIGEDKWRVSSASGEVAAHEEDTILITEGDPEVLTVM